MIEFSQDRLCLTFPEVHPEAKLTIEFQRTLRIPDDGDAYPLPPGLGPFPVQHVDDHAEQVPATWLQHGGVMLPMYQSEAMWLRFSSNMIAGRQAAYPFAIKVAAGKQCAVSGKAWKEGLDRRPQNYMVAPEQPWLDGYVVKKGEIRQFVAMPLGAGYSAEEQITGKAEHGGLQLAVFPMNRDVFEQRFPERQVGDRHMFRWSGAAGTSAFLGASKSSRPDMGLAPGGRMRQKIHADPYQPADWRLDVSSRCFVHLCNSLVWQSTTGSPPPHPAPTAKQYAKAGLPWFEYYDEDAAAVDGAEVLSSLKSVAELSEENGDAALPENESVTAKNLIVYRRGLKPAEVREGMF